MAQLSADRVTNEYRGRTIELTAGGTVYAGAMVAMNTDGKAVAATTSGKDVVGIARNGAVEDGKVKVVFEGVFGLDNGTGDGVALTAANIGGKCYVGDDHTVNATATTTVGETTTTNNAVAGKVVGFDGATVLVKI